MSAVGSQIGGGHYTKLAIQPFQFTAANGWDAFLHTILKYITRFRDKNGAEDLRKALHVAQLRVELNAELPRMWWTGKPTIRMSDYIRFNGIPAVDDAVFYALEAWAEAGNNNHRVITREMFLKLMRDMIDRYVN